MPLPLPSMRTRRALLALLAAWCATTASAANASPCVVSASVSTDLGSYSPAAVKAKAVPALQSRAGLACGSSLLVLLGGNTIRATFRSQNALKLVRDGGGGSVVYKASADPGGTYPFAQGTTIDYMQNNLLNLLGLLGGSTADLPFSIRPDETAAPPVGTYRDQVTIDWNWYLCPGGINAAGLCIGTLDTGSGRSTIALTLTVTPQNATMAITSSTTWDPTNYTSYPKALPGSRRLYTVTLANPDIVALDSAPIQIVVPTPGGTVIALDGDGASGGAAIRSVDGSPTSTLTARYNGPADTSDDVDFSSDGGQSWTYVPVAGNLASEAAVTHVRVRPQGTMAKQSSFTVFVPYLVR